MNALLISVNFHIFLQVYIQSLNIRKLSIIECPSNFSIFSMKLMIAQIIMKFVINLIKISKISLIPKLR